MGSVLVVGDIGLFFVALGTPRLFGEAAACRLGYLDLDWTKKTATAKPGGLGMRRVCNPLLWASSYHKPVELVKLDSKIRLCWHCQQSAQSFRRRAPAGPLSDKAAVRHLFCAIPGCISLRMIKFRFDDLHRILLVTFEAEGTALNFARLDELLVAFVERHGTTDTIVDFSAPELGTLNTDEIIARASRPSRMPGRRRVFVAASDHVFGMMRLYGAHQDGVGETTPAWCAVSMSPLCFSVPRWIDSIRSPSRTRRDRRPPIRADRPGRKPPIPPNWMQFPICIPCVRHGPRVHQRP